MNVRVRKANHVYAPEEKSNKGLIQAGKHKHLKKIDSSASTNTHTK